MIFTRVFRWYSHSLNKHPWRTQLLTSGCLAATGDLISQLCIEKRSVIKEYDPKRTIRFFGFGCFYFGPMLRCWYTVLNRYVHLRSCPKLSPVFRVAVDQSLFGPCIVSGFLILLRLSEGNDLDTAVRKWKNDFFDIYTTGLKLWPAVQLVNFYLLPLRFQMLFVQTVSLFWNIYVAWRTNRHADLVGTVSY